ncbi:hypothetical protein RRG08_005377 [Elysia crispata]|uniref:Reverse transcriptase domain-containing protein n=1 Tax=Elysia crispata TaxID=231223 RepID=A0AAE1CMW0_9GAST|nr:hypothetical protein RRG08_005377 [Elysia crispata]
MWRRLQWFLCMRMQSLQTQNDSESEDEPQIEEVAKVTTAEARVATQTLRRFAEQQEKGDCLFSPSGIIEDRNARALDNNPYTVIRIALRTYDPARYRPVRSGYPATGKHVNQYNLCHGDCAEPEGGRTVVQSTAICMIPAALQVSVGTQKATRVNCRQTGRRQRETTAVQFQAKAFDKVKHEKLFEMLNQLDIDGKDLRVLRNLYWDQTAAVRVGGELSEYTNIKRGVRQGCVMSPDLFNLYSKVILRNLDGSEGLKANGENLNNLRYADDTSLLAGSEEDLQRLLNIVVEESEKLGLSLNVKKTECMVVSKKKNNPECKLLARENKSGKYRNSNT